MSSVMISASSSVSRKTATRSSALEDSNFFQMLSALSSLGSRGGGGVGSPTSRRLNGRGIGRERLRDNGSHREGAAGGPTAARFAASS